MLFLYLNALVLDVVLRLVSGLVEGKPGDLHWSVGHEQESELELGHVLAWRSTNRQSLGVRGQPMKTCDSEI